MNAEPARSRLTIISGFLGAGKTTWLRHQLRDGAFRHQLILVNEAAAFAVDDALLSDAYRIEVLAGGCACCVGHERLIAWLAEKCAAPEQANGGHFVLETSGLANPAAIVAGIRSDRLLSSVLTVGEVVVLVDAESGLRRLASETFFRTQVATADCLIVTKLDVAGADAVPGLLATLRALNPVAPMFGSARGVECALPPYDEVEPVFLPQDASPQEDSDIVVASLPLDASVNWTTLDLWLSALLHAHGPNVLRVKGFARSPEGRLLIQAADGRAQPPVVVADDPGAENRNSIVIIGRGFRAEGLKRSLAYFARAAAEPS